MKQKILVTVLLIAVVVVAGCTSTQSGDTILPDGSIQKSDGTIIKQNGVMVKPDGTMLPPEGSPEGTMVKEDGTIVKPDGTMIKPDGAMVVPEEGAIMETKFSGTVLAGSSAQLIDFNKADYDKAIASDKVILLYFYASWCTICRAEVPELYSAFNEIDSNRIVGFRVNFNDGDTDAGEKALAQQFQVPYQHTKIILKDDKVVLKAPDSWNKARYITEINKVLG